jgi:hypothetical protein
MGRNLQRERSSKGLTSYRPRSLQEEVEEFQTIRSRRVVRQLAVSSFGNPWSNRFFLSRRSMGNTRHRC